MKIKLILLGLVLTTTVTESEAQRVSIRLDFPSHYHTRAYGHAPYRGAVWVGPQWRWSRGRYVSSPGYWSKPKRHHSVWIDGYWQYSRRGYRWVPGYWR